MTFNKKALLAPARKSWGFTLIEAMIVVAIIAILAAIAYPSYERYIIRANRSAAQQAMLGIASRQEQYMLDARTYTVTLGTGGLNYAQDGWDCAADPLKCTNARYEITAALIAGPPPGYTITAAAQGRQLSDGNLTLDNLGVKTPPDKWKK